MLAIIVTATTSLAIGLWIGTFKTTLEHNRKMKILIEIINNKTIKELESIRPSFNDKKSIDNYINILREVTE